MAASGTLAHARLDRYLASLARRPARFARGARRLCAALDARGIDLELTDPSAWRKAEGCSRVGVEHQFSAEIEAVRTLERAEEVRLAQRIEFARTRMQRALERAASGPDPADDLALPPPIHRRRQEWHALRLEMVERNLYLVLGTVERYRHTSADRSDLIQAAAASLFRAVDGFDWRRGVRFKTYAAHWLKQGCRSHLYNLNSLVRVPVYLQKSLKHVNAALQRLGDPHASDEEIARETGLRPRVIASARTAVRRTRSLDDLDGSSLVDSKLTVQEDEGRFSSALGGASLQASVEAALDKLTDRERRVVRLRFGIGCGRVHLYSEVATELGVSLERVRQILLRALAKMRAPRVLKMLEPLIS